MTALALAAVLTAPAYADPLDLLTDDAEDTGSEAELLPGQPRGEAPVVGGTFVASGDWPDTAGVMFSTSWLDVSCTGTLVAPDVVLTAGHCAEGVRRVILDTNDYNRGGEIIAVTEIHEYPDSWNNYDIAALVLAEESTVKPRPIAREEDIVDGAPVVIVGYGAHNAQGTAYDSRLREARTTISDADCSITSSGCNPSVSPGGELGAGGDGVDSCYGDSGGPLYLETDHGTFLVGVTSRSYWGVNLPCEEGGIYVRPDAVIDWIEDVTGRSLAGSPPEPVAEPIYIPKNTAGTAHIIPHDPDGDDGDFTYEIGVGPGSGAATVDEDGIVRYQPEHGFKGEDTILIDVTDASGLTGRGTITVKVLSDGDYRAATGQGGCGCSTGTSGAVGLAAPLAMLALLRRRASRR